MADPRRVQTPDGVVHEFPPDATDAEISAALNSTGGGGTSQVASEPSTWDRLKSAAYEASPLPLLKKENLPLIAGAIGGAATGGAGLIPVIAGAALSGAAGEAARQAVSGEQPDAAGVATQGAIQGGAEALGGGFGAAMGKAAPWLMQTALKPGMSTLKEYGITGQQLAKSMLDEGISVTEGGFKKLTKLFSQNNQEIKDALSNRDALLQRLLGDSAVVDKKNVAARTLQTAQRLSEQVDPSKDLRAVGQTVQRFMNHPTMPGNLTLPEAQAMKVGTYQQIGSKYGELSSGQVEAQKALARGLKEEIEAEAPQIKDMNARDTRLMASLDAVGKRIALSGNHDPIGLAWVTHNPTTFLAAVIDRSAAAKSLLARGMFNSAATAARVSPQLLRAALGAISPETSDAPDDAPPRP